MNSAALHRDTPTLHAIVLAQQAEIEHLKLVIPKLRRMHIGQRSEKIDDMLGQLELALEELGTCKAERSDITDVPMKMLPANSCANRSLSICRARR